ncbi:MAG: LysE family translocator [Nitratireductor sp.]|nr:LysE family translocator [Nitratireductor sp.]
MDFLPAAPVLLAYVASVMVLNYTPGPDMTYFIGRTLSQGRWSGFAALLGTSSGIIIHTLLVAFGLSALMAASPRLFLVLKTAGALYLAWLAIQAIRRGSVFKLANNGVPQLSLFASWWNGLAINVLNPKIVLFFLTFLPQFVSPSDPHATGKLVFLGLVFSIVGVLTMIPLLFVASAFATRMRTSPRLLRAMDWILATILGAFAIRLLISVRN